MPALPPVSRVPPLPLPTPPMRRLSSIFAAVALPSLLVGGAAVATIALPRVAVAQAGTIAGTYVLDRKASDNVEKAIQAAVKDMNFITKPIARGRLNKTNQPYQRVIIATAGANTVITIDSLPPRQAPSNGTPIDWKRPADGEKMKLSMKWDGGHLVETFKPEDGQRVNEYVLSPDGSTLTMHVTITSPRLPKPLKYNLVYRKA